MKSPWPAPKALPAAGFRTNNGNPEGPLHIALNHGKLSVTLNGKPVDGIEKSIPIDTDVDVSGEETPIAAHVNGWRFWVYNQKAPAALSLPAWPISLMTRPSG